MSHHSVAILELGTKKEGKIASIPRPMLTESIVGSIYQIKIQTNGISNPTATAKVLISDLQRQVKGLKIKYLQVADSTITMQVVGSPFLWSIVLGLMPTILALTGVVVSFISVYVIMSSVPTWALSLFVVGVGLLIFHRPVGRLLGGR